MTEEISVAPGVYYYPEYFDRLAQEAIRDKILSHVNELGWFQPTLPRWGTPFSVKMMNFGSLGWVSDKSGYRYQSTHPDSGLNWPPIPIDMLSLWSNIKRRFDNPARVFDKVGIDTPGADFDTLNAASDSPEACLINYYGPAAKMGLHQDKDEQELRAPVVSVSLGDTATFKIGTEMRNGATLSLKLHSGDVLAFGGPARLAFHGITRIYPGTSTLLEKGGRINLTLRRVTKLPA
jgi:alkylated DNA repair protein (DNA oxidative demethylase)